MGHERARSWVNKGKGCSRRAKEDEIRWHNESDGR